MTTKEDYYISKYDLEKKILEKEIEAKQSYIDRNIQLSLVANRGHLILNSVDLLLWIFSIFGFIAIIIALIKWVF